MIRNIIKIKIIKMFIVNFFRRGLEWAGYSYKDANVVFLGLDNSGKTTLVYTMIQERLTPAFHTPDPYP